MRVVVSQVHAAVRRGGGPGAPGGDLAQMNNSMPVRCRVKGEDVSLSATGQTYHPRLGSGLSSGQFHHSTTRQIANVSVHVAPGLLPRAVPVPHSVQNRLPVLQQNRDLESVIGSRPAGHIYDRLRRGP